MLSDGSIADLSGRTTKNKMTEAEAGVVDAKAYFGSWTPSCYSENTGELALSGPVSLLDNGDINTPYPGHTLTVSYFLGEYDEEDVSMIRWYTVKDGTQTLVATMIASVGKSYKIKTDDVGSLIKVEVTPMTLSGKSAQPVSITMETAVKEGYEDPGASQGEA